MNPARAALTRAVNKAIADGSPVYEEIPSNRPVNTEYPYAPEDGWVEFCGHQSPVAATQLVDYRDHGRKDGFFTCLAGDLRWANVMAYRIRKPHDRPMAAAGLTSYRYDNGVYGWVMIGARDHEDALREAERSITGIAIIDNLQIWNGTEYVPVEV